MDRQQEETGEYHLAELLIHLTTCCSIQRLCLSGFDVGVHSATNTSYLPLSSAIQGLLLDDTYSRLNLLSSMFVQCVRTKLKRAAML
jgi:hypothetical protein